MDLFDISQSHILFLKNVYITECINVNDIGEIFDSSSSSSEEYDEIDEDIPEIEDDTLVVDLQRMISDTERMKNLMGQTCRKEDIMKVYNTSMIIREEIPDYFYDIKSWTKFTHLKCWSCDRNFTSRPWFIPLKYEKILVKDSVEDPGEEKIAMKVHGNFCTCNCAKWWIEYVRDPDIGNSKDELWEKNQLLIELYQKFNNEKISYIPPSPRKTEMIHFGGKMLASEFGTEIENRNKVHSYEISKDFNQI